jgi:signal transduction histidine kinase
MNIKKAVSSSIVLRFTIWNVSIFLLILLMFNIFIIYTINYVLEHNLDIRLKHEAENILATLDINPPFITVADSAELNEPDLSEITENPYFLQIYDGSGEIIIHSRNTGSFKPIPPEFPEDKESFFINKTLSGGENLRTYYHSFRDVNNSVYAYMQLSSFKMGSDLIFDEIILFNLLTLPIIIIIVVFASIFLAKRSVNPLIQIINTAEKISASNLSERIDYKAESRDEYGRLRDTLNKLFASLEDQVKNITQFTDHASHQLLNPLTAIKGELDYLLKKERGISEYKEAMEMFNEQTDKMISIIKSLLMLSKEERGNDQVFSVTDCTAFIKSLERFYKNKNVRFENKCNCMIKGEEEKLFIAISNIIDNGLKYSEEGVSVVFSQYKNDFILKVVDEGIGIKDEYKEKVFERFFRTEEVEIKGIKGYGLGLSLSRSIIKRLQGSIIITDNSPKGTIFTIKIPTLNIS